jgi:thiol-disulfide isomerase/thioredoxin
VRVVSCVSLLAVGVGLAGCRSVAPKAKPSPTASVPAGGANNGAPFWAAPDASVRVPATASIAGPGANLTGDPVGQPGNDPEVSGILAGRLVDGFGRSPGSAFVQVAMVGDRAGPPIDVATVHQGHFYIRGLRPGRTYRLVARAKVDGRLLVGEVQARPPETRLLIPLGEELAGTSTPPIPGPPVVPPGRLSGGPARPADPQPPIDPVRTPAAALGPPSAGGDGGDQTASASAQSFPRVNIPAPVAVPPIQPQSFNVTPPSTAVAPRPSDCFVNGNRVVSLRLPDADGREWDFANRRGRLVLLDFWGTWCGPCLRAVPEISRLHSTYAGSGLEVVGVACERGSPADNARRVRDTRQRLKIGYRLVLADPPDRCQDQFHITGYPTLVLLDGDGTIIWRGTPEQERELESIIRRRLGY